MIKLLLFINIVITFKYCLADEDCATNCAEKTNCRECIRAHHCCVWCYQKDYQYPRCFSKAIMNQTKCENIENNFPSKVEVTQDASFTDVMDGVNEAVQFRPNTYSIDLRYGEPVNISIQYRPAKNYPLDLYYLMDLTMSMQPDLETLKNLGSELTNLLKKLTRNHRIAFGSYIDKPEMPFYRTDPVSKENPCSSASKTCEKGYLFKHKLNFTNNIETFIGKVSESDVSANSDDLEGGMDAVMQIILCGNRLGWSHNSRKLIIVATEGQMHFAGDGILAGYVARNKDLCLVDSDGNYSSLIHYDYPSLEELHYQLQEKKINMIIAAKSNVHSYYTSLANLLPKNLYVGELKNESSNVLSLTKEGYYAFMRQTNLKTNTSGIRAKGLKVDFFADCDGDDSWQQKHYCTNAEEGKVMNFKVQFTLNEYLDEEASDEIYIEESSINDKMKVNLRYIGSTCKCALLSQDQTKICVHGVLNCGDCLCDDGWTGDDCSNECKNNPAMCRYVDDNGILSLMCSGRGDCQCSKCVCNSPRYPGKFCQFECPYDRWSHQVCGGNGDCVNGTCICNNQYSGDTCLCHESKENCKIPGTESLCNGNGVCKCDKCSCNKGYSGQYCEFCNECRGLCHHYQKYVVEHVVQRNPQNGTIRVEIVEDLPEEERTCVYRYNLKDGTKCDIFYKYTINKDRSVTVKTTERICNTPLAAGVYIGLILGAFLLFAALIIIGWKATNHYRDKREYEEFLRNQKNAYHSEQNPIYKNPVVSYRNPIETVTVHSKNE